MNKITLTILVFAFVACQQETEFPIQKSSPQYVLNSFISTDSSVVVRISKTASLSDNYAEDIKNAEVYLSNKDTQFILVFDSNFYKSTYRPKAGETYNITAKIKDTDIVLRGKSTVPFPSKINEFKISTFINLNDLQPEDHLMNISFTPNNIGNDTSYYHLRVYTRSYHKKHPDSLNLVLFENEYHDSGIDSDDPIVLNEPYRKGLQMISDLGGINIVLFKTTEKEMQNISIKYTGGKDIYYEGEIRYDKHDGIVELRTVSKEYYNYQVSLIKHDYSAYGDIFYGSGYSPIYTNIENGLGVFAAYSTDTVMFSREEEIIEY